MSPQTDENARPSGPVLQAISPERMNKHYNDVQLANGHTAGEVQAKAALVDSLSDTHTPGATGADTSASIAHTPTAAALQRAVLGREEAEAALRRTQQSLHEARESERIISQKYEALREEARHAQEKHARQREKEREFAQKTIKDVSKNAFLNSSALMERVSNLTEERNSLAKQLEKEKIAREQAEHTAIEHEMSLQEAGQEAQKLRSMIQSLEHDNRADELENRCKSAEEEILSLQARIMELEHTSKGLAQQIDKSKEQICVLEEELKIERDAHERTVGEHLESNHTVGKLMQEINSLREQLKAANDEISSKDEALSQERSKASRRSRTATPQNGRSRSSLTSKLRNSAQFSPSLMDSPTSNFAFLADSEIDSVEKLKRDLQWERKLRQRAEDLINFMKLECQFQQCSCRIAEKKGTRYIHDKVYDKEVRQELKRIHESRSKSKVDSGGDIMMATEQIQPEVKQEAFSANDSGLDLSIPEEIPSISERPQESYSNPSQHLTSHNNASVRQTTPDQETDLEFLPESGTFRKVVNDPRPFHEGAASVAGSKQYQTHEHEAHHVELNGQQSPTPQLQPSPEILPQSHDREMPSGRRALTSLSQYADVHMDDHAPPGPAADIPHYFPKEGTFKAKRYHPAPPPRRFRVEKEKHLNGTKDQHHERQHLANLARELSEEPLEYSQVMHNTSITSSRSHPVLTTSRHQFTDENQPSSLPRHHSQPPPIPSTPLSINREEALAQIRARRERAAQQRSKSAMSNGRPNTAAGYRSDDHLTTAGKRRIRDYEFGQTQPGNGRSKRHISEKS